MPRFLANVSLVTALPADAYESDIEFCAEFGALLSGQAEDGWLVLDARNNDAVLGCIDRVGHRVELMEFRGRLRWRKFDSVHAALESLLAGRARMAAARELIAVGSSR